MTMKNEIKVLRGHVSKLKDELAVVQSELNTMKDQVSKDMNKLVELVRNNAS